MIPPSAPAPPHGGARMQQMQTNDLRAIGTSAFVTAARRIHLISRRGAQGVG